MFLERPPEDLANEFRTLYGIFNIASQLQGMESAFEQWVKDQFLDQIDAVHPQTGENPFVLGHVQ